MAINKLTQCYELYRGQIQLSCQLARILRAGRRRRPAVLAQVCLQLLTTCLAGPALG